MTGSIRIRIIKAINPVLLSLAFFVTWKLYYYQRTAVPYMWKGEVVLVGLFFIVYLYLSHLYHGYWIHLNKTTEIIYSQFLSALITTGVMYFVLILLCKRIPSILPLLLMLAAQFCIIWCWAHIADRWYCKTSPRKKTIIVWDERPGLEKLIEETGMDSRLDVIGIYPIDEVRDDPGKILAPAEWIFMCDLHSHDRNQLIKYSIEANKFAYVIPRIGDALMSGADSTHLMHLPILLVRRHPASLEYLAIKRVLDIVISLAAMIIFSPIIAVTALAIKLNDGGDVFYKQDRLTKDGRVFKIIKFRSMKMNAEQDGVARLSSGDNDDRITPVGRFIRKVRIDELPQLINVLNGDMAIVGPRPERPEIAAEYAKDLPEFSLRLQMKAGVTGYAQVYGKYNTTPYDKLLMDLLYTSKAGLIEDFRIIIATVKILFMHESTEGVEEGQTTAVSSGTGAKEQQ